MLPVVPERRNGRLSRPQLARQSCPHKNVSPVAIRNTSPTNGEVSSPSLAILSCGLLLVSMTNRLFFHSNKDIAAPRYATCSIVHGGRSSAGDYTRFCR